MLQQYSMLVGLEDTLRASRLNYLLVMRQSDAARQPTLGMAALLQPTRGSRQHWRRLAVLRLLYFVTRASPEVVSFAPWFRPYGAWLSMALVPPHIVHVSSACAHVACDCILDNCLLLDYVACLGLAIGTSQGILSVSNIRQAKAIANILPVIDCAFLIIIVIFTRASL